jgi:hypothetical protein
VNELKRRAVRLYMRRVWATNERAYSRRRGSMVYTVGCGSDGWGAGGRTRGNLMSAGNPRGV